MTAISLYISTCKYVMQADATDEDTWSDLYRCLPVLRQALSCCVCGHIIAKPRGPSHSECLHNVCAKCIGGKMRLKPQCSWCKDYVDFRDNTHLRILVLCFQKLCEYIQGTPIWSELSAPSQNGDRNPLVTIINEAMEFEDDFISTAMTVLPVTMPVLTPATVPFLGRKRPVSYKLEHSTDDVSEASMQEPPTLSPELETNLFDNDGVSKSKHDKVDGRTDISNIPQLSGEGKIISDCSQLMLPVNILNRRGRVGNKVEKQENETHTGQKRCKYVKAHRRKTLDLLFEPPSKRTRAASLPSVADLSRKLCKCARNHPPSRLTCLGQRCPCYSSHAACIGCMCRGCRNPRNLDSLYNTNTQDTHTQETHGLMNVSELKETEVL